MEDELFRSIYPALHRLAAVVCPAERDAEDLVQEALVRTLRRGPLSELDSPLAYLRRTVVNLAANERRSLGRLRRAAPRLAAVADEGEAPSYPSDVAVLLQLGPLDRAAVWLSAVEGQSAEHIGQVLGCSPEAARTRVSRAHKRLRTLLDEEGTTR
ncbi:MAG TPA: sigma-70 family RNA polymerase sigma factor [Acidimicrobiales bacterium]|nr:sigma-70 family RNA polymerase sigma factor [Acidimicrobiales bacterium]